jgi:hypothetical protein
MIASLAFLVDGSKLSCSQFPILFHPDVLSSFGSIFDSHFPQSISISRQFLFSLIVSKEHSLFAQLLESSSKYHPDCCVEFCLRFLSFQGNAQFNSFCSDRFLLKMFQTTIYYYELGDSLKTSILLKFIFCLISYPSALTHCLISTYFIDGYFWFIFHSQYTILCFDTFHSGLIKCSSIISEISLQLMTKKLSNNFELGKESI